MNFLPVARLEMRAAARSPMTYYSRSLTALVAVSAGLGFVFAGFTRLLSAASAGQGVFCLMTASAYAVLAAQAVLLTCDCISREKREGTLGLLFLTELSGFDIVAGKITGQASRALSCLIAALPAFGFCIVLGGVGAADFIEVMLGLVNTLFYFAALGILISACVRRDRVATAWGGLALLVLGTLWPALSAAFNFPALAVIVPAGEIMAVLGPVAGFPGPQNIAISFFVSHALAWVFIGIASHIVPGTIKRETAVTPFRRPVSSSGLAEKADPSLSLGILIMICAIAVAAMQLGPAWMMLPAVPVTIVLLHGILKFQTASQAARSLAAKRRTGELELLLTTPFDEDEILRACLLGLKRSLLWPTLFALAADITLLVSAWDKIDTGDGFFWVLALVVELMWLALNLYGLSWIGLCLGLQLANPAKAAGRALFYIVLLPWLMVVCLGALIGLLIPGVRSGAEFFVPGMIALPVTVVLCNTYFIGRAINQLRDHFRALTVRAGNG